MNISNMRRATRARQALAAFKGDEPGVAESSEMIVDLLTDLHHLMQERNQIGIEELLDEWLLTAHHHYRQEK